ncbi:haloacid dehalogenase type II [Saccharopolyspora dendranthemae]|uniref:2-haloacid dehalogenase n=1 Tax=Saccharopolyspora dendranthemae TaxID=1181886 RepID=A0A561V8H1_9PSEU|nr:haloacid dehalogenase type II [Saccharopolyspora dendranthemae]TWG07890.1 2-haloacid dehalogenase [Saccharopolyspora dendranthemae]
MPEIEAVAFDVVETLMSLEEVPGRLAEGGHPAELFGAWFDRAVRDGMALAAAGGYRSFDEICAAALRDITGQDGQATVDYVLGGWDRFPAHDDVLPALEQLREAGVRVIGLTTGSAETIRGFFGHNGLSEHVEAVLSCADVGIWKPAPGAYHYAAEWLGLQPHRVALVAAHAWDCHGATRAGLRTGWVSRLEGRYNPTFDPADSVGDDLPSTIRGLLS